METLVSFLLASVVTFFFVRRYLKNLTAPRKHIAKAGDHAHSAAPAKMHPCPRCGKAIPQDATFCQHCGAALAMWTVHRAAVQTASAGAPKGKARPVINASLCIGCGSCVDVCPEQGDGPVILAGKLGNDGFSGFHRNYVARLSDSAKSAPWTQQRG